MTRSKAKDEMRGHKVQQHENKLGGCSVMKMARERAERGQRERRGDGSTIDEARAQTGEGSTQQWAPMEADRC